MSVRFDAPTDRVTWTGTAPTPATGITIVFWAYVSTDQNANSTYLRLHSSSGSSTVFNCATDLDGTTPCAFMVGGTVTGAASAAAGTWARIAYTVTGTTCKVYVALGDTGSTQLVTGTTGSSASTAPLSGYTVGGRSISDSSEYFNGRISYLRVWSTVLTQTEIEAEWVSATPARTSLLFADYPLVVHTDLLDHSGNGRHLSAGTTAVSTEADAPLPAPITATLGVGLPSLGASLHGGVAVTGTLSATLPALVTAAAGGVRIVGQLAAALPHLESGLTGGLVVGGQLAVTLPALVLTAAGSVTIAGELDADLPQLTVALHGVLGSGSGSLIASLPPLAAHLAGGVTVVGELDATLPALSAALAGPVDGALAATLPGLRLALSGALSQPVTGILHVTLPALTMASPGSAWPPNVEGSFEVPFISVS